MMKKNMTKRITCSLIGVVLISIAVAIFRYCDIGTDPFSCFNLGIVNKTGLSFGNVQVIVNVTLVLVLFFVGRSYFGIGTLMSMLLVGYISDFLLSIVPVQATDLPMYVRYLILFGGLIITSAGISLYSCAKLGISAYDAMSFIVVERSSGKLHLQYVRIAVDVLLVIGGYLMGSVVGIGTLIVALGVGPLVAFFINKMVVPYIFPENQ